MTQKRISSSESLRMEYNSRDAAGGIRLTYSSQGQKPSTSCHTSRGSIHRRIRCGRASERSGRDQHAGGISQEAKSTSPGLGSHVKTRAPSGTEDLHFASHSCTVLAGWACSSLLSTR